MDDEKKYSRKEFIKKSSAAAAGLPFALSASSYENILGANDRIHVAFIGCGRRVGGYYESLESPYNTRLSYICDVKKSQRDKVAEDLKSQLSYTPKLTDDIREVLDDSKVDAVFIATPDHWHVPGSLMALKADKNVYVEKPCSHNPAESEMIVKAQQKYDNVVQMGNQQRSSAHTIEIINEIHNGIIGKPYKAVAFYSNNRPRTPNPVRQDPPADLNWELFQGPAPHEAYRHNTWNYNWHWYGWKWGTAETGNNATHELDIARWALDVEYPEQVTVDAAKRHFPDDGWTMYDSMYATFRFPGEEVINWDGKSRNGLNTYGSGRGTIIYGTEGSVFVNRSLYKLNDREGKTVRERTSGGDEQGTALGGGGSMSTAHLVNFFEAIRGNAEQNSPIGEGAKSTHLCHLANIAYRHPNQHSLDLNTDNGRINDQEAMKFWSREYEPGWKPTI